MKPLAKKVFESSQHITVEIRAVRPGAYRIVNGVAIEDEEPVDPRSKVSGVRKRVPT